MLRLLSDSAVLERLGQAIRAERAQRQWRQEDLAERAGVAPRTISRMEAGEPAQTDTLLRVFRVLDMLDRLDAVIAPSLAPAPSPLDDDDEQDSVTLPQRVRLPGPGF